MLSGYELAYYTSFSIIHQEPDANELDLTSKQLETTCVFLVIYEVLLESKYAEIEVTSMTDNDSGLEQDASGNRPPSNAYNTCQVCSMEKLAFSSAPIYRSSWDLMGIIFYKLTRKSYVYTFGVVLLDVLCGRPAVDESLNEDQCVLALWAQDRIREGKLNCIIDTRLTGQISSKCLKKLADIACRCLHDIPNLRPTVAEIVAGLEVILSLQERLDSFETEGKFVNKVYLLFVSKPKVSTLISALTSDAKGKPSNKIEGTCCQADNFDRLFKSLSFSFQEVRRNLVLPSKFLLYHVLL
ncbi:concanavalin A-like lectin/glucanase [Tanacetum coccineum]